MIKIEVENGRANIYTPYNPGFVRKIKGVGGSKWNSSEKYWSIPEEMIEVAREIMVEVYGYSDVKENETISLKLTFNESVVSPRSDVVLFGKILSHACGRDSGAKVGDDAAYISGCATSGGSEKNWNSVVKEGSIVILSYVNKNIYEKSEIECDITVEILETKVNKQQLLEEKERLLKRISEIDKLLQE